MQSTSFLIKGFLDVTLFMVNKDLAGFTWAAECFCIIPGTFFLLF